MFRKISFTSFVFILFTFNVSAAGSSSSGDGESTKPKTNYEKAVTHIKAAKNTKKKVILKKQTKDMKKHKNF